MHASEYVNWLQEVENYKKEIADLQTKLKRRNKQIADLKHRLKIAEEEHAYHHEDDGE